MEPEGWLAMLGLLTTQDVAHSTIPFFEYAIALLSH